MVKTDVVVIGAGPGGYVAAIRASQLGKKVVIVEKEWVGGVCLNVGCIPSKALIEASHKYNDLQYYEDFGLPVPEINVDFAKVQSYKQTVVDKLTSGVKSLLKAHDIDTIYGKAKFQDKHTLIINDDSGEETTLTFSEAIIATGSNPVELGALPYSDRILNSTGVLSLNKVPDSLIIIGGGVIGIELATVYANFGAKVTIIEGLRTILPTFNPKVSAVVKKELENKGVEIYTGARVTTSEIKNDDVEVLADIDGKKKKFKGEYCLVSVGRIPNSQKLGLDIIGVKVDEKGYIEKDDQNRTSVPNIFAIGDVTHGAQLAHKASYEGKIAAEVIAGKDVMNDYYAMPAVVFSDPEISQVGTTESNLKEKGIQYIAKRFPFGGVGRAIAMNQTKGFVNLIVDKESGKVLGAEIVGPNASDLINEISVAIESGLTAEDLALTIHPHPTLGEAVMEAAELVTGFPIHTI